MAISSCFALAAHALVVLVHEGDRGATSDFIAQSASTHPARVRRVLAPLGRQGIVRGKEGSGGGYVLARDPETITLDEVFEAVESGPVFPVHPRTPSEDCPVGAQIIPALHELQTDVDGAVREVLRGRSLAWFVERVLGHEAAALSA
ncbi:MAG TPA: Rrf2 family transcriptional regulator [Longimicrobiales bacterium]|nr:Rrf2 family transcriptional regulator [Longimicrobiales bacterium]